MAQRPRTATGQLVFSTNRFVGNLCKRLHIAVSYNPISYRITGDKVIGVKA